MKKVIILLVLKLIASNFIIAQQTDQIVNELHKASVKQFMDYEKKHGNYIETDNVIMHYLTWGDPSDTPLIWLHGTYSNAYELLDIVESLVDRNLYVIAVDYYGHGLTPVPSEEVSLYHVADDINHLMIELNLNQAIIGGWSRGGAIATAFYDAYPGKVRGLILEDGGSVGWDEPNHKEEISSYENDINQYFESHTVSPIYASEVDAYTSIFNRLAISNKSEIVSNKRELFTSIASIQKLGDGQFQFNPNVEELICEDSAENYLDAVYRTFQSNTLFGASSHLIFPKIIFRNLHVPILIFDPIGENDWFDFKEENGVLKSTHSNLIDLKVYDNTGHDIKHEYPEKFLTDVFAFIARIRKTE